MQALQDFFARTDLLTLLSTWAVKLVIALLIYVVGKWIAKRVTPAAGLGRGGPNMKFDRASSPTLVGIDASPM